MNSNYRDFLDSLDARVTDPVTYAKSLSEYLGNKAKIYNDQISALSMICEAIDEDGKPYNIIKYLDDNQLGLTPGEQLCEAAATVFTIPEEIQDTIDYSTHELPVEIANLINTYANGALPVEGSIASFSDAIRAIVANRDGLATNTAEIINTASGLVKTSWSKVSSAISKINEESNILIGTIDTFASGAVEDVNSFLNASRSYISDALQSTELMSKVKGVVSMCSGSVMDMVRGVSTLLTDAVKVAEEEAIDNDPTFNCMTTIGDYTGVSSASAWGTSQVTVFSTAAKAISTTVVAAAAAVGAVIKVGVKLVGKLWKKYVSPLFSNPVFVSNSKYDRETLDYPVLSIKFRRNSPIWNIRCAINQSEYDSLSNSAADLAQLILASTSSSVAKTEVLGIASRNESFCIDLVFGQGYFYECEDSVYQFDVYLIPTKPFDTNVLAATSNIAAGMPKFSDVIDVLFPEDIGEITPSEDDINSDKKMIECLQASLVRMICYWRIRALAYADYADNYLTDDISVICKYNGELFYTWYNDQGEFTLESTDINDISVSSLVGTKSILRSFGILQNDLSTVTNTSLFDHAAVTTGTIDYDNNTLATRDLYAIDSIFSQVIVGVIAQIASNKYEYMLRVYEDRQDFPVFIPYKMVTQPDSSKYHMQTDKQLRSKAQKLKNLAATVATIVATVAVTFAVKFVTKKFLGKMKEKVQVNAEADRYAYEAMYTAYRSNSKYNFGQPTPEEAQEWRVPTKADVDKAYNDYLKNAKKARRQTNFLSSLGVESTTYDVFSLPEEESEETDVDSDTVSDIVETNLDEVITLIR